MEAIIKRLITLEKKLDAIEKQHQHKKYPIVAHGVIGHVKWFNVKNGYGFITRLDNKKDVFVHGFGIRKNNPQKAKPSLGDKELVQFDLQLVPGRTPEAINVTGPDDQCVLGSRFAPNVLNRGKTANVLSKKMLSVDDDIDHYDEQVEPCEPTPILTSQQPLALVAVDIGDDAGDDDEGSDAAVVDCRDGADNEDETDVPVCSFHASVDCIAMPIYSTFVTQSRYSM